MCHWNSNSSNLCLKIFQKIGFVRPLVFAVLKLFVFCRYLTHLLQWSEKWMNIIIDVASVDAFSWLGECLLTTAHIIHLFVKTEQEIDQELVSRLSS